MSEYPHAEKAEQYARDVIAGRIPSCAHVIGACRRHLEDLRKSKSRTARYRFDAAKAEAACVFVEQLPHVKDQWAARQELIVLEPWQCFVLAMIFGWVEKSTGLRRFREAYVEVPRKNGKSVLGAGIGLYMFLEDGEYGAEVYSGATSEKQAWEVFRPAKAMVDKTPDLVEHYGVTSMAKNLAAPGTSSRFEPVIGKPGDGASPSCAIIDEFHEHQTPDLYDTMRTGMGARSQPLMLIITTAGSDLAGPCYDMHLRVAQVLAGTLEDETLFGIIYGLDDEDDWMDPAVLAKANPNYGVSVQVEPLLKDQRDAIRYPSKTNPFKTKKLNQWVGARSTWLSIPHWHKCGDESLRIEDMHGRSVYLGVDLASRTDLCSVALVFPTDIGGRAGWTSFVRTYLPEGAIERAGNNRANYEAWRLSGHLIVTEGDEIYFDLIREDVRTLSSEYQIEEIAYDPWRAVQLAQQLREDGANTVEFRALKSLFSPPMREMEAAIVAGRWRHPCDPCLTWQIGNVTARPDAGENLYPRKEKAEAKIDGPVSIIMALGRALVAQGEPADPYAERGFLSLDL